MTRITYLIRLNIIKLKIIYVIEAGQEKRVKP